MIDPRETIELGRFLEIAKDLETIKTNNLTEQELQSLKKLINKSEIVLRMASDYESMLGFGKVVRVLIWAGLAAAGILLTAFDVIDLPWSRSSP